MAKKLLAKCIKTYPDEDDMVRFADGEIETEDVKIYHKGKKYFVGHLFDKKFYKEIENAD